jgi:hypothetical protein
VSFRERAAAASWPTRLLVVLTVVTATYTMIVSTTALFGGPETTSFDQAIGGLRVAGAIGCGVSGRSDRRHREGRAR